MNLPAAICWDMDGTIVDTEADWEFAARTLVEREGNRAWRQADTQRTLGASSKILIDLMDECGVTRPDPILALQDLVIERQSAQGIAFMPGAVELLQEAHAAGVKQALVTANERRMVQPVLDALPGCFDAVVCDDDVTIGKPHPLPYLTALERFGVPADQTIAIEDSPTGMTAALGAGLRVLGVSTFSNRFPDGVIIIPTLHEVQLGHLLLTD